MRNRIVYPVLALLAITSLSGCNTPYQKADVVVNISNHISLKEGETYQIDISITGSEEKVIYKSDNEIVITVSDTGLVTALKEGIANITVTHKNFQEIIAFTVTRKNTYMQYTIKNDVTDMSFLEGYPWLNTSIYGNIKKIEKPRLQDDYFANVNYDYLQKVDIPENQARWGSVFENQDVIDEHINEMYTANDSKVKALFDLLDTGAKESIKNEINKIAGLSDDKIMELIQSKDSLMGLSRLFSLVHVTGNDELRLDNPTVGALKGLAIICLTAFYGKGVDKLTSEIVTIANKIGLDIPNLSTRMHDAIERVGLIYVDAHTQNSECKNITTVKNINESLGTSLDVYTMLKQLNLDDDQEIAFSDFSSNYAKCYEKYTAAIWRDYLILRAIFDGRFFIGAEDYYSLLPEIELTNGEKYNPSLSIEVMKRNIINTNFYDVVEREYISRFIPSSDRSKILNVIKEVKDEFFIVLGEQDWLSKETKEQAQAKLTAMDYIAFYTDDYIANSEFTLTTNNIYNELQSYNSYYLDGISKKAIDNDPLALIANSTINAAYSPSENNFKIFHGIAAKGLSEITSEAELYGRYGHTIGHEITHGFDNRGSTYDKDGFKADWWTKDDKDKFEAKVKNMQDYYTNFLTGFKDEKFNGQQLSSEIIADMGGLKVVSNLASKKKMNLDEVFRGFAFSYAYVYTEENAHERNKSDAHPLSYIRCNMTVAQFDLFQQTYNITTDDCMYIPENDRVCIW